MFSCEVDVEASFGEDLVWYGDLFGKISHVTDCGLRLKDKEGGRM